MPFFYYGGNVLKVTLPTTMIVPISERFVTFLRCLKFDLLSDLW